MNAKLSKAFHVTKILIMIVQERKALPNWHPHSIQKVYTTIKLWVDKFVGLHL